MWRAPRCGKWKEKAQTAKNKIPGKRGLKCVVGRRRASPDAQFRSRVARAGGFHSFWGGAVSPNRKPLPLNPM